MSVLEPNKILTPWAASGLKNTIPQAANPVTGNAGYDQGFPAINMTAKEAGGTPPFGQDFNGIFFAITEILRYMQAGGMPTYSADMSTAIGGYPLGALLLKSNGLGFWRNVTANNTSNPDAGGAGWVSESAGNYANATVITAISTTLTAKQAGQAFLFSTASSTCQLPPASSVPAGGAFKIETSSGLTLSVVGGGVMQVGAAQKASLGVIEGAEVTAVSTGSVYWVFGTGSNFIESGSNANGNYTKLANGTLMCYGRLVLNAVQTSQRIYVLTFPFAFINAGVSVNVSWSNSGSLTSGVRSNYVTTEDPTSTSVNLAYRAETDSTLFTGWTAIGRWY